MKTLPFATALALTATPAVFADEAKYALQCTVTIPGTYPGPKELGSLKKLPKDVLEDRLKPYTFELIYEFLPDGKVAVSTNDNDGRMGGTSTMILHTSSLMYSLEAPIDPAKPYDHHYTTIDRQTGHLEGVSSFRNSFDEDFLELLLAHATQLPFLRQSFDETHT